MAPATAQLLLIDPLSLFGRELLELLPRFQDLWSEVSYVHSDDSDEHQIAELQGNTALVPPLTSADDIEGHTAILVASERDTDRLDHLEEFLDRYPETLLVDLSRLERLRDRTYAAAGESTVSAELSQVRVAHPCVVAASRVLEPLGHLHPTALALAAVDPVSAFGSDAIDLLAQQAVARLSGSGVKEGIGEHVLAFNFVAMGEDDSVAEDASQLFPDMTVTVTRTLSGTFHGHMAHISIAFDQEIDVAELLDAWTSSTGLAVHDPPMRTDSVIDSDQVVVIPPGLGPSRRTVAVTAMVDGMLVGGALTTLEILRGLL